MTEKNALDGRISEALTDASVPFDFDVHAMLYSVDAPTLESALQTSFQDRVINLVNPRKEFFAVTLEEVEAVARERGVQIEFTKLAEAREFRETVALRKHASEGEKLLPLTVEFPAVI